MSDMDVGRVIGGVRTPDSFEPGAEEEEQSGDELDAEELDTESDEQDADPADASDTDSDSDTDDTDGEVKADSSEDKEHQTELEDLENKRREWQSKAQASDHDLGMALGEINRLKAEQQPAPASKSSPAMDKLNDLGSEELVDSGTVKAVLKEVQEGQTVNKQQERTRAFLQGIEAATSSKPDIAEVTKYFQENNMANDPDNEKLNSLGNYYRAGVAMLEKEMKTQQESHKRELAKVGKAAEKRAGKHKNMPPVVGGRQNTRANTSGAGGVVGVLQQKRKARGISDDGVFAPPGKA